MYSLIPAADSHCLAMLPRLRANDALLLRTVGGEPLHAMRYSIEQSVESWAWMVDNEPAALFGYAAPSLMGDVAFPWCMTTDTVTQHWIEFWRGSRGIVDYIRGRYPRLEGCCDARYEASLRWLRVLKFKVSEPVLVPALGLSFCHWTG